MRATVPVRLLAGSIALTLSAGIAAALAAPRSSGARVLGDAGAPEILPGRGASASASRRRTPVTALRSPPPMVALPSHPPSRLVSFRVRSPSLRRSVSVWVYLPVGVRPGLLYPSILLLHGNPGGTADFFANGLGPALDRAIASHQIPPTFAIAPDGNAGRQGDSEWVDSSRARLETFVIDELPTALATRLPLDLDRRARAVWGISMGGFGALNLSFRHPEAFASTVSFSGYTFADGSVFEPDTPDGRANSPQLRAAEVARKLDVLLVDAGSGDLPGFSREAETLRDTLRRAGGRVQLHEENADHSWDYWSREIPLALGFLAPRLAPPQPVTPQPTAPQPAP
ncbi:MAG: alpha/beta hydrolase [Acidimicrobiales bacterium]